MHEGLESRSAALLERLLGALPAPEGGAGFVTEAFIAGLSPTPLSPAQVPVLERLAKKVEVARRLCRSYTEDMGKPLDATPIAPGYAEALAAAFFHHGLLRKDWKWINTVLKLDWGILIAPAFQMPDDLPGLLVDFLGERR
jgi:hypothetical protein